ncbi:MAG TPA: DNA polymerase III subunit delta [Candidatus Saccharimonadia bacterium]
MTIFFYGPNRYELLRQLRQMMSAYVAKNGDLGLERLDGSTVSLAALSGVLTAVPFLANSRLVVVENIATNKTVSGKLAELMAGVPASTVVVFTEREVDQRTAAFKALKAADKVVKFEPLAAPKLLAWVKAEVARLGGSIEHAVARELVDRTGDDQWQLENEINKLVNYQPEVTAETVQLLVAQTVERSVFDLVEAMTAGRAGVALVAYQALLEQKETEFYILTMVQWQLRNLLTLKLAPAALSPAEVAAAAGMSAFVAGKAAAAAGRIPEAVLRRAFVAAVDCEFQIKSGRARAEVAVEQLIVRVAGRVAGQVSGRATAQE